MSNSLLHFRRRPPGQRASHKCSAPLYDRTAAQQNRWGKHDAEKWPKRRPGQPPSDDTARPWATRLAEEWVQTSPTTSTTSMRGSSRPQKRAGRRGRPRRRRGLLSTRRRFRRFSTRRTRSGWQRLTRTNSWAVTTRRRGSARPRPPTTRGPPPRAARRPPASDGSLERTSSGIKGRAAKILGCDAHEAPHVGPRGRGADDAGAAAACCAGALPASEGSLEKRTREAIQGTRTKSRVRSLPVRCAGRRAGSGPVHVRRRRCRDRGREVQNTLGRVRDDDAAKERLRERVRARGRRRRRARAQRFACRRLSEHRTRAPAPAADVPVAVAVGVEDARATT